MFVSADVSVWFGLFQSHFMSVCFSLFRFQFVSVTVSARLDLLQFQFVSVCFRLLSVFPCISVRVSGALWVLGALWVEHTRRHAHAISHIMLAQELWKQVSSLMSATWSLLQSTIVHLLLMCLCTDDITTTARLQLIVCLSPILWILRLPVVLLQSKRLMRPVVYQTRCFCTNVIA